MYGAALRFQSLIPSSYLSSTPSPETIVESGLDTFVSSITSDLFPDNT